MGRKFFRRLENPVLVTLPAAILFRIFFLPGAMDGIRFFVQPDWNKLLHIQVRPKISTETILRNDWFNLLSWNIEYLSDSHLLISSLNLIPVTYFCFIPSLMQ